MSEKTLIAYCAPTLAGIKTGNLFAYEESSREGMHRDICAFNALLGKKGLCLRILGEKKGRWLIYVYRPERLRKDLKEKSAQRLLKTFGYTETSLDGLLTRLTERIAKEKSFPHEIGLFLGYPPEDVEGFIKNRGKNAKKTGFWKVYGDEKTAEKMFAQFRKCTYIYTDRHAEGFSLEKLTVCA